jgi:maltooligosyltrehalose trehalohydrolase
VATVHPRIEHEVRKLRSPLMRTHSLLGANYREDGSCDFTVWAPHSTLVEVYFPGQEKTLALTPAEHGYHRGSAQGIAADARYLYRLNRDKKRADPASRFQPEGVFGPSQLVDLATFQWEDADWRGIDLKNYILYELHVGTFTSAGTLDAIIDHLPYLNALGITAIELMPIAQFSGARNWGYDGVFPYAVQNTYGGPAALQRLVNACHQAGLGVVLDVVYNHMGPEGNFLADFGPYFTDRYKTPWGDAINFDGPASDDVVRFFIENAIDWLRDFHIDALRLDAIHGIFDRSAQPFLSLLGIAVDEFAEQTGRRVYLIAESDLNDPRIVRDRELGGYGLHAQWNDDFHHALHSLQTGERIGYYKDFGSLRHLEKAAQQGYVYTGQYSDYRKRRHGNSASAIRPSQLVVFSQNHDQVGNRMLGERSSALLSFEALKLSAGLVLLVPYLPLLFMGEEYAEPAPFLYFTSHEDPPLAKAVRDGRKKEFAAFHDKGLPPDPQAETTFLTSKLNHELRREGLHKVLWDFYRELIRLRKTLPALSEPDASMLSVDTGGTEKFLQIRRTCAQNVVVMFLNFSNEDANCPAEILTDDWRMILNSADEIWMGPGVNACVSDSDSLVVHAKSFCLFCNI